MTSLHWPERDESVSIVFPLVPCLSGRDGEAGRHVERASLRVLAPDRLLQRSIAVCTALRAAGAYLMASFSGLSHAVLVAAGLLLFPTATGELHAAVELERPRLPLHARAECERPDRAAAFEPVSTPVETPVYAARGRAGAPAQIAFLHGMCSRPEFAEAFLGSAVRHGTLIVPEGDVPCPNRRGSTWSHDLEALDGRVTAGLATLGSPARSDVVLAGYSMGATRAEELARKVRRYTRLILIGGPRVPSPAGLAHVHGVVLMAGEHDRQDLMRRGAAAMQSAGIRATFMILPKATHGDMGPEGERVFDEALRWLLRDSTARSDATASVTERDHCTAVSLR